jgi:peptide/nickel transport system ATP-binding protein
VSGDATPKKIAVENVTQMFPGRLGVKVRAVDNVSFTLSSEPATISSLVGASGSGKSTLARMILGLQKPTAGRVTYCGKDIFKLSRRERDQFRRDVQPVFQDPYSIFNPYYRVDRVLWKAIKKFHLVDGKSDAEALIERSLTAVRLKPGEVLGRYAHQLSGGQRQRLMLARLHMLQPSFVIADEPVSMLDAQVRKHFLDIMIEFQQTYGMTTLFITHDLSTVAYVGGDMTTIFKGRLVEQGPVEQVMTRPSHAYTKLLLASVPTPDPDQRWTDRVDLSTGEPRMVPGDGPPRIVAGDEEQESPASVSSRESR